MKSLFGNKIGSAKTDVSTTVSLLAALDGQTAGRPNFVENKVALEAISLEGFSDRASEGVETAVQNLRNMINQAHKQLPAGAADVKLSVAQEEAAVIAGLGSAAAKQYHLRAMPSEGQLRQMFQGAKNGTITQVVGTNAPSVDRVAMEAFDEKINRTSLNYSVAYNMQASRQSEFGEAFYPTVVVTPDNVGFTVSLRLLYAYSEVIRNTSGALNNFNRQNIIRAIIDSTILEADQTRIIPVYRLSSPANATTDSAQYFMSGIGQTTLQVDNAPLVTGPLAFGQKFSLLGISQTNAQIAQGLEDQTDAIDSSVRLQNIYLTLTGTVASTPVTEYFKFDVSQLPLSDFNAAPQGNTRLLQLNFSTQTLLLNSQVLTAEGTASQLLAALGTNSVRIGVNVYGSIIQDVADTQLSVSSLSVVAVNDNQGNSLSTTAGAGATAAALVGAGVFGGYDLLAYRTNSDRRNRGKLIDVQHINYLYTIPVLPPITALRPVADSEANDGNLLANLITSTRIQTANRAVTALLEAKSFLSAYANSPDVIANQPTLFGVASNLVVPAYLDETIDCAQALDSLTTTQRAQDLQTLLLNKIRDMATRLFVSSGFGPAAEAMYEGAPPKPVVIIGTDPTIYRYLTLTGDLRYMGDMFDYKIVMSYDLRMANQLVFSFGFEASFNSGVPNPLHFGNMGWKPELTLMMPMVRNGAQAMELTVQPSYRHVNNLPIMGVLNILNIQTVIGGKVSVDVNNTVIS